MCKLWYEENALKHFFQTTTTQNDATDSRFPTNTNLMRVSSWSAYSQITLKKKQDQLAKQSLTKTDKIKKQQFPNFFLSSQNPNAFVFGPALHKSLANQI